MSDLSETFSRSDDLVRLHREIVRLRLSAEKSAFEHKAETDQLKSKILDAEKAQEDDEFMANKWVAMDTELFQLRIANNELNEMVSRLEHQVSTYRASLIHTQSELNEKQDALSLVSQKLGTSESTLRSHRATNENLATKVQELSMENEALKRSLLKLEQQTTRPPEPKKSGYNPKLFSNANPLPSTGPSEHNALEPEVSVGRKFGAPVTV